MIGIEEKLFQAAAVAEHLVGDRLQAAVPLVHRLDVAVAAPQGDTLQHVRPPWGDLVAGATEISASEGEAGAGEEVGSLNVKTLPTMIPRQEAEIHLETQK